jgi:hypothetical protein
VWWIGRIMYDDVDFVDDDGGRWGWEWWCWGWWGVGEWYWG